ncbi:MotA/TolQ/ExbB proton channel family protein [Burkholderiaceae bacterium FT117]|uniref:MotA/TolQ/ExbB proton channel family protein n=1 Tax=Zeimonas sediminis TaxID=2944268 RepID=UPI002342C308|nr:MotA/TolQ/ExbB proton channel family protein [Zeimonas sediminis]MCM5572201.1 MotA/TolQ/ExbB proton channel family protein [Zeimonas sediminis]
MQERELGLMHFWQAGDAVTHGVAYLLLAMSLVSWYFILSKAWTAWRQRRSAKAALERFWNARSLDEALATMRDTDTERVLLPMTEKAVAAATMRPDQSLAASVDREEMLTRVLRGEITQISSRMESGLTFLASVGSTAPFVGLFGTVWGIYHALIAIASSGQVLIDKVAGPVGEALVMTAAGLAVAIPAVLAYNAFVRVNRIALAELDGFAHDLLALLLTGSRLKESGERDGLKGPVAPLTGGAMVR